MTNFSKADLAVVLSIAGLIIVLVAAGLPFAHVLPPCLPDAYSPLPLRERR